MPIWVQHGDPSLGAGLALSGGLLGGLAEAQQRDQAAQMAQAHAQLAHQNRLDEIDRTSSDTLNREVGLERYKTDAARGSASDVIGGLHVSADELANNPELGAATDAYGRTGHAPAGFWSGLGVLGGMRRQQSGNLTATEAIAKQRADQQASDAANRQKLGLMNFDQRVPEVAARTARDWAETAKLNQTDHTPWLRPGMSGPQSSATSAVYNSRPADVGTYYTPPAGGLPNDVRAAQTAQSFADGALISYAHDHNVPIQTRTARIDSLRGHIPEYQWGQMRSAVQAERQMDMVGMPAHERDAAQAAYMADVFNRVDTEVIQPHHKAMKPLAIFGPPGSTQAEAQAHAEARLRIEKILLQEHVSQEAWDEYLLKLKKP